MAPAPPPVEMTMEIAAGLFVGRLPERLGQMRAAAAERRTADLRRLAHQLKGSGGGFGFPQVSAAAGRLEQAVATAGEGEEAWATVAAALATLAAAAEAVPGYPTPDNAAVRLA